MIADSLAALCQVWSQLGLALLIQSSVVIGLGLGIGWALRPRGPFVQSLVYRTTLITLVFTAALSVFGRPITRPAVRVALPVIDAQRNPIDNAPVPPITNGNSDVLPTSNNTAVNTVLKSVGSTRRVYSPIDFGGCIYELIVAVWAGGTVASLSWLLLGQMTLAVIKRKSAPIIRGAAFEDLQEIRTARNLRSITLVSAPTIRSPFLAGILTSMIFLPSGYEALFDAEALRAIIAHEAAHAERQDNAWMLSARVVRSLLWFQPLLWLLCRNLEQSSEGVCDQMTVTGGCSRRAYADCLLTLVSQSFPTALERSLGAGMIPFRSLVGQRISQLFDASLSIARPTAKMRLATVGGLMVAGVVIVDCVSCGPRSPFGSLGGASTDPTPWPAPAGYLAQFKPDAMPAAGLAPFTKPASEGDVAPVQVVPMDTKPWPESPMPPSPMSAQDIALIRQCKTLTFPETTYSKGDGPSIHDRRVLAQVLAQHPRFFYAECLMADWCLKKGDVRGARSWRALSLADAPAILAGRLQFTDGKPIAGFRFSPYVEFYRTANGMEGPYGFYDPQDLTYPDVTTDDHGCYYLPVWRAICNLDGWGTSISSSDSRPDPQTPSARLAHTMDLMFPAFPAQGIRRVICASRVGVLPPMIARPYVPINAPFTASNQSMDHPLPVHGASLTISWPPYPGAAVYRASLSEVIREPRPQTGYRTNDIDFWTSDPHFHNGSPSTTINLALAGNTPVLSRDRLCDIVITAQDAAGNQLSDSQHMYFQPLDALAPLPFTKASLLKLWPPSVTIEAVTIHGHQATVRGTIPDAANIDMLAQRDLFGWKYDSIIERPLYAGDVFTGRDHFDIKFRNDPEPPGVTTPAAPSSPGRT